MKNILTQSLQMNSDLFESPFTILDLKGMEGSRESILVREYLTGTKEKHRLNENYFSFNPWNDPTILVCNLLLLGSTPISFGCIQRKDFFPESFCRINTRHFLFPEFRAKKFNIENIGKTKDGVLFGGAIIRHQIGLAKKLGYSGVFVSRDRGLRSFQHFMKKTVNDFLQPSLPKLTVISNQKFNVCNAPQVESCWQWIAAASFSEPFEPKMLSTFPTRKEIGN
jgi:hypothetical protein